MKGVLEALRAVFSAGRQPASAASTVFTFRVPAPLAVRLVLAIPPALIGTLTWDWLEDVTGEGYDFGIHPLWIYIWHPPLMDLLFGVLVLSSFISTRRRWWVGAMALVLASFAVHTAGVIAVLNTRSLLDPLVKIPFVTVVPITLVATIALTWVTAAVARLKTSHLLLYSIIAGLIAGIAFLVPLESALYPPSWFWSYNVHWTVWHASIATAIHLSCKGQPP